MVISREGVRGRRSLTVRPAWLSHRAKSRASPSCARATQP